MLEASESLLPLTDQGKPPRVVAVVADAEAKGELGMLLTTLGAELVGEVQRTNAKIHPATFIPLGKLESLRDAVAALGADCVVMDFELSPNQLKNIEQAVGKPVIDRPGVIIEIFSRHARTKESKTQVELARLQYLLPRLAHYWSHFERQRGGGATSRGMGEKQFEVDRRLVKDRIAILRGRLKSVEKERQTQRAGRKDVLKVALVGYTNAGKSTLLNALTHSRVLAENKLFATLDASVRALDPYAHPPLVAIDTVGFIRKLPPALVASFRSTLEELHEADLLLHVVDASSERAREEHDVTLEILAELELSDKPRLTVLNKFDLLKDVGARNRAKAAVPGAHAVSALKDEDVTRLRDAVIAHFRAGLEVFEIVVPYGESRLESQLHAHGSVETTRHLETGTFYRLRMESGWAKKLGLERYRP